MPNNEIDTNQDLKKHHAVRKGVLGHTVIRIDELARVSGADNDTLDFTKDDLIHCGVIDPGFIRASTKIIRDVVGDSNWATAQHRLLTQSLRKYKLSVVSCLLQEVQYFLAHEPPAPIRRNICISQLATGSSKVSDGVGR